MPGPKDFLKAQASVLSQLPDPISPQVANSLIQVANSLPEMPTAPTFPGGQALGLPQFPGLPRIAGLPSLPGLTGAPAGPIEFIQSVETMLPGGAPKFGPALAGGMRSIETPPGPQATPSGGILGGGYRSI